MEQTAQSGRPWRILLVEDSPDDAELMGFALRNAPSGFTLDRVETEEEFTSALEAALPDVILCDYHLPRFSMPRALQIVREERDLDIPFIVVSRLIGEDAAVEAMRKGANDYLLKGRLGRLSSAIATSLERCLSRRDKAAADAALKRSDLLNRSLLNSMSMRIAVLDEAGEVIARNDAWRRFHGDDSGNYLKHLRAIEADANEATGQIRAGIEAVMARREPRFAFEREWPSRSGTRWEMVRAEPLEDSEHGAVISVEDITPRMQTQLALHDAHRRMRQLSKRVLDVQDEERRSIALELHDDVGQSLTALKIALHHLAGRASESEAGKVKLCIAIIDELLEKLRRLAYSLHPPQLDHLGLDGALRGLARMQEEATGVAVECRLSGLDERPQPAVEAACYRIAQEALSNATRHASPTEVVIEVEMKAPLLRLAIRDNGCGFDETEARPRAIRSGSLGLIGMAERAELAGGKLKIRSEPGAGTVVAVTFPVVSAPRPPRQA